MTSGDHAREIPLTTETDRVVRLLLVAGRPADEEGPGIYSFWVQSLEALRELGLENVAGEQPLGTRPLYVGKADDRLASRFNDHFAPRHTGHSTLRRSLAALLGMRALPRSVRANMTPSQITNAIDHYVLSQRDEDKLADWMRQNLSVRAVGSTYWPVRGLELAVGGVLRPPLDQDRPAMWANNPWRPVVAAARGRARAQAKARLLDGYRRQWERPG